MELDRRAFLKSAAALTALNFLPFSGYPALLPAVAGRSKQPARIRGAFFYPPAEVVLAGRNEDSWKTHEWFTWPGNQFEPERQQAKFLAKLREIVAGLDVTLELDEKPIYTDAGIQEFMGKVEQSRPTALLLFNFWNTFSPKICPILEAWNGPAIVYQPVGANHQLPPEFFRTAPRLQYIHSIENWASLARGLRCIHTMNNLAQSRILRVSGQAKAESQAVDSFLGTEILTVPAESFNRIYDEMPVDRQMQRLASTVRKGARKVTDLKDAAFLDAARAHAAVQEIRKRYEADAITIECLFLKHRKPCLSFAMNNGDLFPCGCENHLDATLTLMLGARCFGRGGFQHNPEYDIDQNLYFASHCTCTTRLHGPRSRPAIYDLRPFFHQLPKTMALDVQWPTGQEVTLCKYESTEKRLNAWKGKVVSSPACPPTGGCATRVLVKLEGVEDVCSAYAGPHPILYCGDYVQDLKTLARLYDVEFRSAS